MSRQPTTCLNWLCNDLACGVFTLTKCLWHWPSRLLLAPPLSSPHMLSAAVAQRVPTVDLLLSAPPPVRCRKHHMTGAYALSLATFLKNQVGHTVRLAGKVVSNCL